MNRARLRDLGLTLGRLKPGEFNAITDVDGVRVGHATLVKGDGKLKVGKGPVRTGVTAVIPGAGDPFEERPVAGVSVLNGAGELTGAHQVQEWGLLETPILLTSALSVGACMDAIVRWSVDRHPSLGQAGDVICPVVGECDDSWLNDAAGRHVRPAHALAALEHAHGGEVDEGVVGGGTGLVAFDVKSGIGTSSRVLEKEDGGYTVGALVQANFGRLEDLRLGALGLGALLAPTFDPGPKRPRPGGSAKVILATNAPLLPHQASRLAARASLGLARTGSVAHHGSGEIALAFSTTARSVRSEKGLTRRWLAVADECLDPLFVAAVEATEEAVWNALCASEDMVGRDEHHIRALPLDEVRSILGKGRAKGGEGLSGPLAVAPAPNKSSA